MTPSLTTFKMGLLYQLDDRRGKHLNDIAGSHVHKIRALRELEEMELVSQSIFDQWLLTRHGLAAHLGYWYSGHATTQARLRAAEKAASECKRNEQLFDLETT